ncbi:MAG: hypothetical protein RQ752_12305 [Thermohalobaculum sp.]|nr:hypothetical protein [Thermohalobaculum sp.]
MSVIPFDRERPFPLRGRHRAAGPDAVEGDAERVRSLMMERALALALQENARTRERARRAEERVEQLTADLMRAQLAEPSQPHCLPRVG